MWIICNWSFNAFTFLIKRSSTFLARKVSEIYVYIIKRQCDPVLVWMRHPVTKIRPIERSQVWCNLFVLSWLCVHLCWCRCGLRCWKRFIIVIQYSVRLSLQMQWELRVSFVRAICYLLLWRAGEILLFLFCLPVSWTGALKMLAGSRFSSLDVLWFSARFLWASEMNLCVSIGPLRGFVFPLAAVCFVP